MTQVIRSETELVLAVYRTQLFNAGDLDNVKTVQAGYKAQPLSTFLGQTGPKASAIDFITPLTPDTQKTSLVGAGKTFDASVLIPEMKRVHRGLQ